MNYQRFSFPFVPLITIGIVPATSSCLPQPCPWQLASYSSVHEPGRHVIGSAEQDIGVVPAWLGLVGEPVCVVESFQRGVDVVVVPTRRVPCTPMGYNGRRRRMRKTSARGKNQGLVFSKYCKYMRANICFRLALLGLLMQ